MYHFMSGYTAKVAGTEEGINEPQATFSACFGAPFMPLHPREYANLLGQKIDEHHVDVWLVNTGWTGGPFGVGHRMELKHTRAMIRAILDGTLSSIQTRQDQNFRIEVPTICPDVPDDVLYPRKTWSDQDDYEARAKELAQRFAENFKRYAEDVDSKVLAAGPVVAG